jgi:hypothetical protein
MSFVFFHIEVGNNAVLAGKSLIKGTRIERHGLTASEWGECK